MDSITQNITLGDVKRLENLATQLSTIAQTLRTDLNECIANDDVDGYRSNELDAIDEVNDLWTEVGDWIANVEVEE